MTSNTLWASVNFFGQITIQKRDFVSVSTMELRTLYIQELPYINSFCQCILKKIGRMHVHFQQLKEINVVKVRFTMMYSSRKLNNKKVITTFEDNLLVLSRFMAAQTTIISAPRRLEKYCFEFPAFFHQTNIDVTSCFCRQLFRPLYEDKGQKITIFNCEYLGDACFNWSETS